MILRNSIVTILITFFAFSCTKTIDIAGFNEEAWMHDKNGCEGIRSSMLDQLLEIREQLKALDTNEIIAVLGRPDKTRLGERNQKYFIYHISPGEHCEGSLTENNNTLSIRFNAVGLAYEVIVR